MTNTYISSADVVVACPGGKIIGGPEPAGILLGRRDLVAAAFMNSAPHHAFARAMKVSKEEVVGMVKAIELLRSGRRNRDAEDTEWRAGVRPISDHISRVPRVFGQIHEPKNKQN